MAVAIQQWAIQMPSGMSMPDFYDSNREASKQVVLSAVRLSKAAESDVSSIQNIQQAGKTGLKSPSRPNRVIMKSVNVLNLSYFPPHYRLVSSCPRGLNLCFSLVGTPVYFLDRMLSNSVNVLGGQALLLFFNDWQGREDVLETFLLFPAYDTNTSVDMFYEECSLTYQSDLDRLLLGGFGSRYFSDWVLFCPLGSI